MLITNPQQKKQIEEFVDKDHTVMDKYYEIIDSNVSQAKVMKAMRKFMELDPDFYDPFHIVVDRLFERGKKVEATAILKYAYERAIMRIVDARGQWPKVMRWGFLENRHLMRIIDRYAMFCWEAGKVDEALTIFRQLLKVNPTDNQGSRYNILAIRMALGYEEWEKPFESKHNGVVVGLNGIKLAEWFDKNSEKFPEDFLVDDEDRK